MLMLQTIPSIAQILQYVNTGHFSSICLCFICFDFEGVGVSLTDDVCVCLVLWHSGMYSHVFIIEPIETPGSTRASDSQ